MYVCLYTVSYKWKNCATILSVRVVVVTYSGPQNPETRGGQPRKFDPWTQPNPEKQNPNQPQRQPILNFTFKKPENPRGTSPKCWSWTRLKPKKQNPNQPRHQLILNFTLKIPETLKTRGGHPRNVDSRTWPKPEKQTPNPTWPQHLLPEYITSCRRCTLNSRSSWE